MAKGSTAVRPMFCTNHAVRRYGDQHRGASSEDLIAGLHAGLAVDGAVVWTVLQRYGAPAPTDRFVLARDRAGIFVVTRTPQDTDLVVTYLRFSVAQQALAWRLWPDGSVVVAAVVAPPVEPAPSRATPPSKPEKKGSVNVQVHPGLGVAMGLIRVEDTLREAWGGANAVRRAILHGDIVEMDAWAERFRLRVMRGEETVELVVRWLGDCRWQAESAGIAVSASA